MAKEYRTAGELQARKIIAEADRERTPHRGGGLRAGAAPQGRGRCGSLPHLRGAFSQNPALLQVPAHPAGLREVPGREHDAVSSRRRRGAAHAPPAAARRAGAIGARLRRRRAVSAEPCASPSVVAARHGKPGAGSAPAEELSPDLGAGAAMTRARGQRSTHARIEIALAAPVAASELAGPIATGSACSRRRCVGTYLRHRLLRRQCRRARGGAPVRRHRGPRRAGHALPAALAGGSRRRAQDHQRDEDRRRLRAARERLADRDRRRAADRRHQHPQRGAGGAVRDRQPVRLSCSRSSSRRRWSERSRKAC